MNGQDSREKVLIVGAGPGGLAAGALLAARAGVPVDVFERAPTIGGRATSFAGDHLAPGEFSSVLRSAAHSWVLRSSPDLGDLAASGRLRGYTIDAGLHIAFNADRGRIFPLLEALGKRVQLGWNDAGWFHDGARFWPVEPGAPFPWMSGADMAELKRISREMVGMPIREAERLDAVPLHDYLRQRVTSPAAIQFHEVVGSFCATLNDPRKISAGDVIKMNRSTSRSGCHLARKSAGYVTEPGGYRVFSDRLREAIEEHGGTVRVGSPVREVVVRDGRVEGIVAEVGGRAERLAASRVIVNTGVRDLFSIVDARSFPAPVVDRVNRLWSAGGVTGYLGLKRRVVDARGLYLISRLLGPREGFATDVRGITVILSNWAPAVAPPGRQLIVIFAPLEEAEVRDPGKAGQAADALLDFHLRSFPGLAEALDWSLFIATDRVSPVAQSVDQMGEAKLSVRSPHVEGLYLVGEPLGAWGCVTDAAVESALRCAGEISGQDFLGLLPDYYRD